MHPDFSPVSFCMFRITDDFDHLMDCVYEFKRKSNVMIMITVSQIHLFIMQKRR